MIRDLGPRTPKCWRARKDCYSRDERGCKVRGKELLVLSQSYATEAEQKGAIVKCPPERVRLPQETTKVQERKKEVMGFQARRRK